MLCIELSQLLLLRCEFSEELVESALQEELEFDLPQHEESSASILLRSFFSAFHSRHGEAMNEIGCGEIFPSPMLDLYRFGRSCCQGAPLACLRFFNKRSA